MGAFGSLIGRLDRRMLSVADHEHVGQADVKSESRSVKQSASPLQGLPGIKPSLSDHSHAAIDMLLFVH
jgi:hypothetical protein